MTVTLRNIHELNAVNNAADGDPVCMTKVYEKTWQGGVGLKNAKE